tara:strand:+ start:179 stop:427 length:249 start_codon:yes stop_codon:yes gene_type:complete
MGQTRARWKVLPKGQRKVEGKLMVQQRAIGKVPLRVNLRVTQRARRRVGECLLEQRKAPQKVQMMDRRRERRRVLELLAGTG